MKTKDIKPGVVYGYRQRLTGKIEPVVFLAKPGPDQLYQYAQRSGVRPTKALFERATGHRPHSQQRYTDIDVGYPAVFADTEPTPEILAEMAEATLDQFLKARSEYDGERGIRYRLVTVPSRIVGPYDEAVAEEKRQREARQRQYEKEFAAREAAQKRADKLVASLGQHGVIGSWNIGPEPTALVIPLDDVEKLIGLLDAQTGAGR